MQIDKNSVSAENQLKESEYVSYINPEGKGRRIMFVGNSITRHGVNLEIGWNNDFGMAASSVQNDYVHVLAEKMKEIYPDAVICVCQAALWEMHYETGGDVFDYFSKAREFKADTIVMRIIENCDYVSFKNELFYNNYKLFINYLNSNDAQIILTSGFWKHPGDSDIEAVAKEKGYDFVYLGDLGEDDAMKATGLFEHTGVAGHPGDRGMRKIADRIFNKMKV